MPRPDPTLTVVATHASIIHKRQLLPTSKKSDSSLLGPPRGSDSDVMSRHLLLIDTHRGRRHTTALWLARPPVSVDPLWKLQLQAATMRSAGTYTARSHGSRKENPLMIDKCSLTWNDHIAQPQGIHFYLITLHRWGQGFRDNISRCRPIERVGRISLRGQLLCVSSS